MKSPKATTTRTRTAKPAKEKVAKAPAKVKAPSRRKAVASRMSARMRAPRPIARLLRLTDPRAALESLIESKGVVKAVESGARIEVQGFSKGQERFTFAKIPHTLDIPDLIELQKESFNWFITEGLREAFASISPIKDFTGNLDPRVRRA